MYKIYDLNSEVFDNLTTEEQKNLFHQIKQNIMNKLLNGI